MDILTKVQAEAERVIAHVTRISTAIHTKLNAIDKKIEALDPAADRPIQRIVDSPRTILWVMLLGALLFGLGIWVGAKL